MKKLSVSMGSALPDPMKSMAAVSPVPSPAISNKTAPGKIGPKGLSPRTTYSRVNTGVAPTPDAGGQAQKSLPPQGLNFLPTKTAEAEELMSTMVQRPNLQDLLTSAMEGTIEKTAVSQEAARQLGTQTGVGLEKEAAAPDHYSTEYIQKLAGAVGYLSEMYKQADEGNVQKPGEGPGAIQVLEMNRDEKNIDATELGSGKKDLQPKVDPPVQKEEVQVGKANTGMQTNDEMGHAEQPLEPIKNEKAQIAPTNPLPTPTTQTKQSSALYLENLAALGLVDPHVAMIRKVAEDALSPSKIEAGRQNPPDASAAEEGQVKVPSDHKSQAGSMVHSNQSAIDYKKREAKENPKQDVNQVLDQPALTRRHDPVLHKTLDNANKAGVKLSSDQTKVAAARALLLNLQEKVAEENKGEKQSAKKQKESMMGAAPTSPSAASGFTASSLQ